MCEAYSIRDQGRLTFGTALVDLEKSMALNLIREQSLKTASRLGFTVNNALPLPDEVQYARTTDETVKRLVCLHATAACAYGFDRGMAAAWLRQENAFDNLAASERRFIENGDGTQPDV